MSKVGRAGCAAARCRPTISAPSLFAGIEQNIGHLAILDRRVDRMCGSGLVPCVRSDALKGETKWLRRDEDSKASSMLGI